MMQDGRNIPTNSIIEADICIFGAGAAGFVMALELENAGLKVLLAEGGGREFDEATQSLYEGATGSPAIEFSRLRYLGGSTNCWMGRCRPLDPLDFSERPWVPNSGWPVPYEELVPYFAKTSGLLKIGPYSQFNEIDWSTNLFPGQYFANFKTQDSRVEGFPFFQVQDPPLRFASTFLKKIDQSKNINLLLHSNLTHIQSNRLANRVVEAQISTLSGNKFKIRAKKYVLAMGGLENPRLLMHSNDIAVHGIGNSHDQVGRYFMGHPQTGMGTVLYSNEDRCFAKESIAAPIGQLFFGLTPEIQKQEKLLNAGIWLYRDIDPGEQAFRVARRDLLRGRIPENLGEKLIEITQNWRSVGNTFACNLIGKRKKADQWKFWIQTEQTPDPNNRVFLSREIDPLGIPRLNVRRGYNDLDRITATKSSKIFGSELTRLGMGRVRFNDEHESYPLFTGQQDETFGHDMGTTRMSNDPKHGVVDSDCKVHGMQNLYVAGSSVFPTAGFANPTMTIIALAMRLADHLKSH